MRYHIGQYISILRVYQTSLIPFIGTIIKASTIQCTCSHICLNYGLGWGESPMGAPCHGLSERLMIEGNEIDEIEYCKNRFTPELALVEFQPLNKNIINKITEVE